MAVLAGEADWVWGTYQTPNLTFQAPRTEPQRKKHLLVVLIPQTAVFL